MREGLSFIVKTPHEEVLRAPFDALRVPTETGQVGILPRAERAVLAVEPGLVVARRGERTVLVGTAGGVLHIEAREVTLLSALAVVGGDGGAVRSALASLVEAPSAEMELRRRIESLERGLLSESRRHSSARRTEVRR